jgi:AAA+ superfamily predicted ATPase
MINIKNSHKRRRRGSRIMDQITLKEQVQKSEDEKRLEQSDFEYMDEMSLLNTVNHGNTSTVYPYRMEYVPMFIYEFLKTYLYGLNTGVLKDERLKINSFMGLSSGTNPIATAPQIAGFNNEGLAIVENRFILVDLYFDGARYQVSVFFIANGGNGPFFTIKHYISALGIDGKAMKTQEVIDYLADESIKNSIYRNKIINMSFSNDSKLDIKVVDRSKFENEKLEEIFIPKAVKSEIVKFKNCVEKHGTFKIGLRYMLCGEPGTGKTKSVRTLMNLCYGKATIIMAEGDIKFKNVFEFAKLFSPAIICFDDLDLIIGSRDHSFDRESLGEFLQQLDGFQKNDVFLLCTTNDKDLIDKAASRPGRFDLVLDFGKINKSNYVDIIRANCKDENIIALFDESLLDNLRKKKVTGAFIVNLIKQLEIKSTLEPEADLKDYIKDFMKISYKGFYEKYKDEEVLTGFGFSNNGNE